MSFLFSKLISIDRRRRCPSERLLIVINDVKSYSSSWVSASPWHRVVRCGRSLVMERYRSQAVSYSETGSRLWEVPVNDKSSFPAYFEDIRIYSPEDHLGL